MPPTPHILVVDDDPGLLEMITTALKAYQYEVSAIPVTSELFSFLDNMNTLPDLVLLDVYWAGNDGRTICRELKTNDTYKNIPVILYSAGDISDASIRHSMADQFFPKPFNISKLVKTIQQLTGDNV